MGLSFWQYLLSSQDVSSASSQRCWRPATWHIGYSTPPTLFPPPLPECRVSLPVAYCPLAGSPARVGIALGCGCDSDRLPSRRARLCLPEPLAAGRARAAGSAPAAQAGHQPALHLLRQSPGLASRPHAAKEVD